jgi:hypothetical protein
MPTSKEPASTIIPIATHTPSRLLGATTPNEPHPTLPMACENMVASGSAVPASLGATSTQRIATTASEYPPQRDSTGNLKRATNASEGIKSNKRDRRRCRAMHCTGGSRSSHATLLRAPAPSHFGWSRFAPNLGAASRRMPRLRESKQNHARATNASEGVKSIERAPRKMPRDALRSRFQIDPRRGSRRVTPTGRNSQPA